MVKPMTLLLICSFTLASFFAYGQDVTKSSAGYWVDGKRNDFEKGIATSVAVAGGDVVVAGMTSDGPCYWRNGKRFSLPVLDTAQPSSALGVALFEKRVYVVGFTTSSGNLSNPCIWVDGKRADLPTTDRAQDGKAVAVAITKNGVYIAGSIGDRPCYWANGKLTPIADLAPGSVGVGGIAVAGSDVYICGYAPSPCYWLNGARTDLAIPTGSFAWTTGIAVSGGGIYVAGSIRIGGDPSKPCYWANGKPASLSTKDPNQGGLAFGVATQGRSVYVAGASSTEGGDIWVPCYWIDGKRVDLSVLDPSTEIFCGGIGVSGGLIYVVETGGAEY